MKENIKWNDITKACKLLSNQIKKQNIDNPILVAISRGGLIPARLIAKHLNIRKIYSLGLESYNDDTHEQHGFNIYQTFTEKFPDNSKVIIVDDIIDSGKSLELAIKLVCQNKIHEHGICVYAAAIHYKDCASHKPDVFYKKVKENNWIVYPWE